MDREDELIERCVKHLNALPFVRKVKVIGEVRTKKRTDLTVLLTTDRETYRLAVEIKRTHLTRGVLQGILANADYRGGQGWILFAPHVGRNLGEYLNEQEVNYVDATGNCRLHLDAGYFIQIEGRPAKRMHAKQAGIRVPGLHVLFAILARPNLINAPIRTLAQAAGVGKTAAADRLQQLREAGYMVEAKGRTRLVRAKAILDQWIAGYENQVRPRMLIGQYMTQDKTPADLEQRVQDTLRDKVTWAWGGGAAANRLTGYYRGQETVLHVGGATITDLPKRLRALPAKNGPLTILRTPGTVGFEGELPQTVHPLLVYTELIVAHGERAQDAAKEIWGRYLEKRQ